MRSEKKSENVRSLEGNHHAERKRPDQVAPPPSENAESIPEYAPEVLTGGHGGPIPALIVRLVRSLFTRDSNQKS